MKESGKGSCQGDAEAGGGASPAKPGLPKDRIKALLKKKLKPVHQEIIAPPGE